MIVSPRKVYTRRKLITWWSCGGTARLRAARQSPNLAVRALYELHFRHEECKKRSNGTLPDPLEQW
uniref:Uncharacterized protein n=1 Tax=Anguilla anguilla TaxID=7936 RepID=A0A0E9QUA0_ANGAN